MPPKRPRRLPRHQVVEQSDYDSEAHITDHNGPNIINAAVPPPTRTNEEINLTILQRHDPDVQQILSVAPFAVVYYFSSASLTWEKSGVEGTLFVNQLTPATTVNGHIIERFGVMVLNRKGLNNFSTELKSEAHVDVTEDYVILQVEDEEEGVEGAAGEQIYGLWIFSEAGSSTEHARQINAQVIQECALRSGKSRETAAGAFGIEDHAYAETEQQQPPNIRHDELAVYSNVEPSDHGMQGPTMQPVELAAPHQGQQIDLLSLFASKQQTPVYHDQHDTRQTQQYRPMEQQYQHPHQLATFPHAHPAPAAHATQAQNLLNLFKR